MSPFTDTDTDTDTGLAGQTVGWAHEYDVPVDPMDLLQCDSCQ